MEISASISSGVLYECVMLIVSVLEKKKTILGVEPVSFSALQDHEKNDLDRDHNHLTKYDLRSRSDPDLT